MDKNLTIRIVGKRPTFTVIAETDDAASVTGTLTLPDDLFELAATIRTYGVTREVERETQAASTPAPDLKALGRALFQNLFSPSIRRLLDGLLGAPGKGVRVRLNITADNEAAELASLPWELLTRDDATPEPPLALAKDTVLVRTIDVPKDTPAVTFDGTLKVLLIVSNPTGTAKLDLKREEGRIADAFGPINRGWAIDVLETATVEAISDKLANARPAYHIVHFMGHGDFDPATGRGAVLLEHEDESAHRLEGEQFRSLLDNSHPLPQLVFLNACKTATTAGAATDPADPVRRTQNPFGGVAAALLAGGIPSVLAMQYPITDASAIQFATLFYKRLATGVPVDEAVADARRMLYNSDSHEWATPVLYLRPKHGLLFSLEAVRTAAPVTSPAPEQARVVAPPAATPPAATEGAQPASDADRSTPATGVAPARLTPSAQMVAQSASGEPPFRVFLAATAITPSFTQRMRPQLIRDLAAKGIEVLPAVPNMDNPDEFTEAGHEARLREVAASADLFVHICNEDAGDVLDGGSADGPGVPATFPVAQMQLGARIQKPQLVILNDAATVPADTAYGRFLAQVEAMDRERHELEFDRVRYAKMAERIALQRDRILADRERAAQEAARAAQQAAAAAANVGGSVYVDVHVNDLAQATPLIKYLKSRGTRVVYTDPMGDDADAITPDGPQAAEQQFKKKIGDADNVIFFFGSVEAKWVASRYTVAIQHKVTSNLPTLLGLYVTSERPPEQLRFANMSPIVKGMNGLDPAAVDALLAGRAS